MNRSFFYSFAFCCFCFSSGENNWFDFLFNERKKTIQFFFASVTNQKISRWISYQVRMTSTWKSSAFFFCSSQVSIDSIYCFKTRAKIALTFDVRNVDIFQYQSISIRVNFTLVWKRSNCIFVPLCFIVISVSNLVYKKSMSQVCLWCIS